nr:MAG TPA: hypothetical protein [Caudoviricetes sp.]
MKILLEIPLCTGESWCVYTMSDKNFWNNEKN